MSSQDKVKVAVRVRPFNRREIDLGTRCIVEMRDNQVILYNPNSTSTSSSQAKTDDSKNQGNKKSANATSNSTNTSQFKQFTFDHAFWSLKQDDPHFASQEIVYKELGIGVLENAFSGYNACILAYGQTGSGKSYSMMGAPSPTPSPCGAALQPNAGLIPRLCQAIFNRIQIEEQQNHGMDDPDQIVNERRQYKVEVSYMEIYNEKVRDLLDPKGCQGIQSSGHAGGRDRSSASSLHTLRVREHNIYGPYVEGLSRLAVKSFDEIETLIGEGNKSRTVAATAMNAESSRSHAVFTLRLTCICSDTKSGVSGEKVSKISLVDLAGSERATKTGAVGDRLKEGSNINRSLTTLGLVISKLADQSSSKGSSGADKENFIPYRDSVLTWLLKDSLGGNSKTVMVATISPSSDNYEETLSTLRYADRAKRIVNHAVINEDPNAKIIRELREEVELLRKQLAMISHGGKLPVLSDKTLDERMTESPELKERLNESEKLIKEMEESWEEKLKKTEKIHIERQQELERMGICVDSSGIKLQADGKANQRFYLVNLNADPALNQVLVYYLTRAETKVGRGSQDVENGDGKDNVDIELVGIGIQPLHCKLVIEPFGNGIPSDESQLYIEPVAGRNCVNGKPVKEKTFLKHGDRLLWGHNHFFRVNCPSRPTQGGPPSESNEVMNYDFMNEFELARDESLFPIGPDSNDGSVGSEQTSSLHTARNGTEVIKALEKQHEMDKQKALQSQAQMYEQKLEQLKSCMSPTTPYAPYGSLADISGLSVGSRGSLSSGFGAGAFGGSSWSVMSPGRAERWAEERDQFFKESLQRLKEEVVRASALADEANLMAEELHRPVEFRVTLQIPASNLSANRRKSAFVAQPAILVKYRKKGGNQRSSQIWTLDKLENKLVDMREYYQYEMNKKLSKFTGKDVARNEHIKLRGDPFTETQENHVLIGVANLFLECLLFDVTLDYQVPIINQQGEVAGRLHVECSRTEGHIVPPCDRMADAADTEDEKEPQAWEEQPRSSDEIKVKIVIKAARGLPISLSNFVFCQYAFWGQDCDDVIVVPGMSDNGNTSQSGNQILGVSPSRTPKKTTFRFDHAREYTVQVNEEFWEFINEGGALSIEVWGNKCAGFSSARTAGWDTTLWISQDRTTEGNAPQNDSSNENEAKNGKHAIKNATQALRGETSRSLVDRWAEVRRRIRMYVEIQELNQKGEWEAVDIKPDPDVATGGIYQLRQGQARRIKVKVEPFNDSLEKAGTLPVAVDGVNCVQIGCVTHRSRLQRSLDSYQEGDLNLLREKWNEALNLRRHHLDLEIQKLIQKPSGQKTEDDVEREQMLIQQWIQLTEERNAVNCPQPENEGVIPGAPLPTNFVPEPGYEKHIPVLFLDLNNATPSTAGYSSTLASGTPYDSLQCTSLNSIDIGIPCAGINSFLPKELNCNQLRGGRSPFPDGSGLGDSTAFIALPILRQSEDAVECVCAWDASIHDSAYLNRCTNEASERIFLILRVHLRLSHPQTMDLILRKRICISINPPNAASSSNCSTTSGSASLVQGFVASSGRSLTERFKQTLGFGAQSPARGPSSPLSTSISPSTLNSRITGTGVIYEIVSSIPHATEDIEDRESLAIKAVEQELKLRKSTSSISSPKSSSTALDSTKDEAADSGTHTPEGISYIERYTRAVNALESTLQLDKLRQQVAVKELLAAKQNEKLRSVHNLNSRLSPTSIASQAYVSAFGPGGMNSMRKTLSVPNFGGLTLSPGSSYNNLSVSGGVSSGCAPRTSLNGNNQMQAAPQISDDDIDSFLTGVRRAAASTNNDNQSRSTKSEAHGSPGGYSMKPKSSNSCGSGTYDVIVEEERH